MSLSKSIIDIATSEKEEKALRGIRDALGYMILDTQQRHSVTERRFVRETNSILIETMRLQIKSMKEDVYRLRALNELLDYKRMFACIRYDKVCGIGGFALREDLAHIALRALYEVIVLINTGKCIKSQLMEQYHATVHEVSAEEIVFAMVHRAAASSENFAHDADNFIRDMWHKSYNLMWNEDLFSHKLHLAFPRSVAVLRNRARIVTSVAALEDAIAACKLVGGYDEVIAVMKKELESANIALEEDGKCFTS